MATAEDFEIARPCCPYTTKLKEIAQQMLEMLERMRSGAQGVEESLLEAKQKIDLLLMED